MSKNRRRRTARLRAEAAAIERRLAGAVVPNVGGPLLGRANIAYEFSERSKGTAHGGLSLIHISRGGRTDVGHRTAPL